MNRIRSCNKYFVYALLTIIVPMVVSDKVRGQTGEVTGVQGTGVSTGGVAVAQGTVAPTGEVATLKKEIKDLTTELSAFKSQTASLATTLSNINNAMGTITNDIQIARPNRIPEDVRYLADFMNHENVVVINGQVYAVESQLLNTLGAVFLLDRTFSTDTNGVSIKDKLVELHKQAVPQTNGVVSLLPLSPYEHVEALYEANKIEDWKFHRLRYGVSAFYNHEIGGLGAGITLRGYPAYSRYIDGRFIDFENAFWRRISVQVSVGGMLTRDDEETDSTGLVGTLGLGWDIVYGVSLFVGESFYSYSKPGEDGSKTDHATVFGVTLNAEFWQTLFSGR